MTFKFHPIALMTLVAVATAVSFAAEIDDQIDALQQKFEQRYPELRQFKKDGVIGETAEGFVAFVKGEDAAAASLVNDENADRRTLYKLIAQKEQTTEEKVAERNARRNFRNADKGEFLRDKSGQWSQKGKD